MLRSMYSGISGLKNFQTKLDVIGNNIANVNTFGFKKGRTVFKDMINQTVSGASGPTMARGGVNPQQVGLGSQLAAIDTIFTEGSTQTTNRVLDLAIAGDGFFQVATASGAHEDGTGRPGFTEERMYTRAGNFYWDEDGYITNVDGYFLYGYAYDNLDDAVHPDDIEYNDDGQLQGDISQKPIRIPTDAKDMSISNDGSITYVDSGGELKWAGQIVLAKFPNDGGLEKIGNNFYQESMNSGQPIEDFPGNSGIGGTESGVLEMSNVDLSEEFTEMIVAQRGFQANTRIITTSDEILQELVNLKR